MVLLLVAVILNYNSDGTFIIGYLTVIGSFFVLSTIGYDEHGNSFAFLMTLPVMRKTYAGEKYLIGFLAVKGFEIAGKDLGQMVENCQHFT